MKNAADSVPEKVDAQSLDDSSPAEMVQVPHYRRDLFPSNIALSADDVRDFCELLSEANERAKQLEFSKVDLTKFTSREDAEHHINSFMPIEYNYRLSNGDSVQGLGIPRTNDRKFPEDIFSVFVSNSSFSERTINTRPLNTVDVFLCFEKPSLKIDLQTFPSNPTENRSVINIAGRDEDWVISTTQKIEEFFKKKKTSRPVIHKAGTYDYFVYILFIPIYIWAIYQLDEYFTFWLNERSTFLNVIVGIYALLLTLLLARFIFQYIRWVYPPMEYYKKSRTKTFIHRGIAGIISFSIVFGALYNLWKIILEWISL